MRRMRVHFRATLVLAFLACIAAAILIEVSGCREREKGQVTLELYVPCAFQAPTVKVTQLFEQRHPNIKSVSVVENVSVLAPKIEKGDKPDVFMCIGDIEVDRLEEKGLVQHRSTFCFVTLALVTPEDNPANVQSLKALANDSVKYVGIGALSTSVGHYAEKLLKEMGIWEKVEPKKVSPKEPVQLLNLARLGKVEASLAYAACFMAGKEFEQYQKLASGINVVKILVREAEACVTVACPAASIKGCKHPKEAALFIDFLREEAVQKILEDSGFLALSEPKCF